MASPPIRAWTPTVDEERAFRSTDATFQWLCHLHVDHVKQYAGKWVAARDCGILAHADSLDALLSEIGDVDLQTVIIDRVERPAWVVYR